MNSSSDMIYDIITDVAAAKGKMKETVLADHIHDGGLRNVLIAALNPFITYGITIKPGSFVMGKANTAEFTQDTWSMLYALQHRKLTGNAARDRVQEELERLSPRSADVLTWILNKDVRAGFTANTVNRVEKDLIPEFKCMLAHKFEEKRVKKWPIAVEPKLDGVRVLAMAHADGMGFFSRTGKPFSTF